MRTERIEHWTFAALLLAFAVLVVSGLFLTFHYRPTYGEDHGATIAHRVAAFAAIGLAAVLAGCGIVRRRLWSIGVVLVLVAAVVTGDDLPWSQLALWAVTVGGDFSGVLRAAFDDQIRFVLMEDREVSQGAYRLALLLHLVAVPLFLGVFLFLSRRVGAAGGTTIRRGGTMADAVTMLEQDHRRVEQLFAQYQNTRDPSLVRQICTELKVHTTIEEEVVYPVVVSDLPDGKELDKEARKEHDEVEDAIKQIESVGYDSAEVDGLMDTIIEGVQHHVEEEESEMFPKLQEELGTNKLTQLGKKLAQAKQRAMGGSQTVVEGDLAEMTKDQLYKQAQEADIPGRSDMTKDELKEALQNQ